MTKKSITKNYLYNLSYQILVLLTPLLTTPYVSRVLGSYGVGQYSFAYSLISYFILFATFGFNHYAQREIARNQEDKRKQSVIFWEIIISRSITVSISLIIHFILLVLNVYGEYTSLMLILSINIFSIFFDINFLFQGNENFAKITLRNTLTKVLGIALIFIFVNEPNDIGVYTFCHSLIVIISNLLMWIGINKNIETIDFNDLKIFRHIKPSLKLFIPTIAISLYTVFDKTLIGMLIEGNTIAISENGEEIIVKISDMENGYYEQSEKIVKMAMTILTSLNAIMIPRNSFEVTKKDLSGFKNNVNNSLRFVFFIGTPLMLGLSSIATNFSPWFFGAGYDKVPYLIIIFSPLPLIIGISNVIGLQYLLPLKKESKYTISICIGAIVNFLLNVFLIPKFYSYGAAISTIFAELSIVIIMFKYARKDIKIKKIISTNWKYLLSGIVMFIFVSMTNNYLTPSFKNTFLLIAEGVFVYFLSLVLLKDKYIVSFIGKYIRKNKRR